MSEDYQAPSGAEHPITPPQWQVDAWCKQALAMGADVDAVFLKAARWGADQELNECCKWLPKLPPWSADDLRAARRPKPPSLKEQALSLLSNVDKPVMLGTPEYRLSEADAATIRRALEQLDD